MLFVQIDPFRGQQIKNTNLHFKCLKQRTYFILKLRISCTVRFNNNKYLSTSPNEAYAYIRNDIYGLILKWCISLIH